MFLEVVDVSGDHHIRSCNLRDCKNYDSWTLDMYFAEKYKSIELKSTHLYYQNLLIYSRLYVSNNWLNHNLPFSCNNSFYLHYYNKARILHVRTAGALQEIITRNLHQISYFNNQI